jgi:hypothetical protein
MSKHGGSAFPETETDVYYDRDAGTHYPHTYSYGGMTLRDYFAGQALQGFAVAVCIASAEAFTPDKAAAVAYQFADAMLKQRSDGDKHSEGQP